MIMWPFKKKIKAPDVPRIVPPAVPTKKVGKHFDIITVPGDGVGSDDLRALIFAYMRSEFPMSDFYWYGNQSLVSVGWLDQKVNVTVIMGRDSA